MEREPRRERVERQPARDERLAVRDRVGHRERELLDRIAPRLARVVAGDRDRVEAWQSARRVLDHVAAEAQRRRRRIDERLTREELFQYVVLERPSEVGRRGALTLG